MSPEQEVQFMANRGGYFIEYRKPKKTYPDFGKGNCVCCGKKLPPPKRKYCCDDCQQEYYWNTNDL